MSQQTRCWGNREAAQPRCLLHKFGGARLTLPLYRRRSEPEKPSNPNAKTTHPPYQQSMSAESVHGLCFPTARGERWSDSERFYLFPTEYTSELVSSAASWGWRFAERDAARSRLVGLESWQNTHHTTFQAPVIRELASHVACTNKSAEASVCVVAAPPRGRCERWEQICPGKTLVVVELGNVDLGAPLCASLWSRCLASPRLRRVVSQRPLLRSKPWRGRCSWADNGTIEMPYVGHARAASLEARRRTHRVLACGPQGPKWRIDFFREQRKKEF